MSKQSTNLHSFEFVQVEHKINTSITAYILGQAKHQILSQIYRQSSVKKPTRKIFQVVIPSIFYPFTYVAHENPG